MSDKQKSGASELFSHKIQLYLGDAFGVKVPNTEFWVVLTILREGPKVTIQFPVINFETGQFAFDPYEIANPTLINLGIPAEFANFAPPPLNGGYLFTDKGFLPKCLRPAELVNLSYVVASNQGMNIPFNYDLPGVDYTPPVPGYVIQITNQGALIVQGMGTFSNIIPAGTHTLMPTTISYLVKPDVKLCRNTRISSGEINTAVFPFTPEVHRGANDALRDLHINDAFDNVVAYAWSDNSNVADKPNNSTIMNLAVSIGKVSHGKLKMNAPIFLHQFDRFVWDTSVAINRTNSNNIVVSWGIIDMESPDNGQSEAVCYRAVSFDGGLTWPHNGPTNIQPTGIDPNFGIPGGFGDNPGVQCDKYGNFWYLSCNLYNAAGDPNNQPFLMISIDGGITWELAFTFPDNNYCDIPTMTFGGDNLGNYGVYLANDVFPDALLGALDGNPALSFIPVTGLGLYGAGQTTFLTQFTNNCLVGDVAASADGKVWTYGYPAGLEPALYPFPGGAGPNNNRRLLFKSPGALEENYVGPWTVANMGLLQLSLFYPEWTSQPVFGMFQVSRNLVYDENRKALYALTNIRTVSGPSNSQIYLQISRNNGQTWSNPLKIATTDVANRGFQSMALDTVTQNLLIGWYDGREYDNLTGLNYFGAVVEADHLDCLISQIPLSNPVFKDNNFDAPKPAPSKAKVSARRPLRVMTLRSLRKVQENTTMASSTCK